jgi:hypothetical protein
MSSLVALRIAAGRTQDDAASVIGRTQQFVSACERGLRRMNPRDEARLRSVLEDAAHRLEVARSERIAESKFAESVVSALTQGTP